MIRQRTHFDLQTDGEKLPTLETIDSPKGTGENTQPPLPPNIESGIEKIRGRFLAKTKQTNLAKMEKNSKETHEELP